MRYSEDEAICKTIAYVREKMKGDASHDWWHVYRVWKTAVGIAKKEKAGTLVIQLAALLHDIADWKFNSGDEEKGPAMAKEWLKKLDVDEKTISHVCEIIMGMPFKGAGVATPMRTLEGRIVQDADRMDAIGAIGIARAFTYGGYKGRRMHDPEIKPHCHKTFEQYKSSSGTTINHFYEKLLLLKGRMNTKTGKKLAEERHRFMEKFLEYFFSEWEGKR